MPSVDGSTKGYFDFFIPRGGVADGWIYRPASCGIIGHKNIREDRIPEVACANPKGEDRRDHVDLFRRREYADSVLVIQDDALKDLEGHSKSAIGIFLEKWDKRGAVETERIPQGIFLCKGGV